MTASVELVVDGMHCAGCGLLIDDAVEELDGVERCATNVRRRRTRIAYDPGRVAVEAIVATIGDAGYEARVPVQ